MADGELRRSGGLLVKCCRYILKHLLAIYRQPTTDPVDGLFRLLFKSGKDDRNNWLIIEVGLRWW